MTQWHIDLPGVEFWPSDYSDECAAPFGSLRKRIACAVFGHKWGINYYHPLTTEHPYMASQFHACTRCWKLRCIMESVCVKCGLPPHKFELVPHDVYTTDKGDEGFGTQHFHYTCVNLHTYCALGNPISGRAVADESGKIFVYDAGVDEMVEIRYSAME